MPDRGKQIALTMLVGAVAGTSFTLVERTFAADECISEPRGNVPAGGHWYFRLDHAAKRKCWYYKDAAGKIMELPPAKPQRAAKVEEPDAEPQPEPDAAPEIKQSTANARAELPKIARPQPPAMPKPMGALEAEPQIRELSGVGQGSPGTGQNARALSSFDAPPFVGKGFNAPALDAPARGRDSTNASDANAPSDLRSWSVASRWPEPTAVASSDAQTIMTSDPQPTPPALSPSQLAKAVQPNYNLPNNNSPDDLRMLLAVLAGALVFVAITGRLILSYAGNRARKLKRGQRRDIWGAASNEQESFSNYNTFPREPFVPVDPDEEIEQLLSRMSKRARL